MKDRRPAVARVATQRLVQLPDGCQQIARARVLVRRQADPDALPGGNVPPEASILQPLQQRARRSADEGPTRIAVGHQDDLVHALEESAGRGLRDLGRERADPPGQGGRKTQAAAPVLPGWRDGRCKTREERLKFLHESAALRNAATLPVLERVRLHVHVHPGEGLIGSVPVQRQDPGQTLAGPAGIVEPAGVLKDHGVDGDPGTLAQGAHEALDVPRPKLVVQQEARALFEAGVHLPGARRQRGHSGLILIPGPAGKIVHPGGDVCGGDGPEASHENERDDGGKRSRNGHGLPGWVSG